MDRLPDYHIHTPLCQHAVGEPREYAAQALRLGLAEIGFSDHSPMQQDGFDNWRMRLDQLDDYVAQVRQVQAEFPQLTVRLALEVDFIPGQEDWIRELAGLHPWDYLIGSVHYISDTWDVDNPAKRERWRDRDPFEVWSLYFDRLTLAAASGLFDYLGHADLPKKFGHIPHQDCTALFVRFLRAVKERDGAIEINTAGLRKDCREIYPSRALLSLACQHGVPITFGSDAHAPTEVGADFAAAVELATGVGYTQCCRFVQRRRQSAPLKPGGKSVSGE